MTIRCSFRWGSQRHLAANPVTDLGTIPVRIKCRNVQCEARVWLDLHPLSSGNLSAGFLRKTSDFVWRFAKYCSRCVSERCRQHCVQLGESTKHHPMF